MGLFFLLHRHLQHSENKSLCPLNGLLIKDKGLIYGCPGTKKLCQMSKNNRNQKDNDTVIYFCCFSV